MWPTVQRCSASRNPPRLFLLALVSRTIRDKLPAPVPRQFEHALHLLQLILAPDESGQPAPRRELEVRPERPGAQHLVHFDEPIEPFHRRRPKRPELEVTLAQSLRRLAGRDRTCRRRGLHPCRQIGYVTDRRVFGVGAGLNGPHDDFACVNADASFHGRPALVLESLAVKSKLLLHRQCCMECALRVVFVSDRRAEQRKNPVTR